MVLKTYRQGASVIQEGEVGHVFFVIARGEVRVTAEGHRVRTMGKNSFFGERALLLDEHRSASVDVTSLEAELWCVERDAFQSLLTENMREELSYRIMLQDADVTLKSLLHVRLVGRGGFGSVRLVKDKHSGVRYALKRIKVDDGELPELVANECELLAEMDHPFIVRLVAKFEHTKGLYILTELVTGGSLFDQLGRMGLLTRKQAQFYLGSLVLMLEVLHGKNIVYRDLKPENVMLDSRGFLKLIDFGLAKKLDGATHRTFTIAGTSSYMAPEMLSGHGYGTAADIWSLGIMFYEFVCGRLPFGAGLQDDMDISTEICLAPLDFAGYNDQAGIRLLQGFLDRRPEHRIGMGVGGFEEVKAHKFFKAGVSGNLFSSIIGRKVNPPVVPEGEKYSDERELDRFVTLSDEEELGGTA